jgi:hypothetical protein
MRYDILTLKDTLKVHLIESSYDIIALKNMLKVHLIESSYVNQCIFLND